VTASALPRPGSAGAWLLAARPVTLTAAIVPVLVGTACAFATGGFSLLPALAALVGAMLIQVGTNLANDVFDHEKGADTEARLGPTRVVSSGLIGAREVRAAMVVTFGLAVLVGSYLVYVGGWPIVLVGVASIASGVAYTGGPYPLGYHGLGDLFVMVFFGLVAVCGTAYVQAGHVPELAVWASVPVGSLATAILVVNNVRDRETDVVAGKRTLAVRFGRGFGVVEYAVLSIAAYAVPIVLLSRGLGSPFVLLPLAVLPFSAVAGWRLATRSGAALNPVLGATAKILLLHGVLFALGIGLSTR
jgi:1,4-dihydroxy-2-naphthoate octaprenyltransferase